MGIRNLLHAGRTTGRVVFGDEYPAGGAGPRIVPHSTTTSEAVLESLFARNSVMPDNPTNPFDQAINDYNKLLEAKEKLQTEYNELDNKLVDACDAARAWQARSEMHEKECAKLRTERDSAIATVVELATIGNSFVMLGTKMTEVAAKAAKPKPKPLEGLEAGDKPMMFEAQGNNPDSGQYTITNTPRPGETNEQMAARNRLPANTYSSGK